MHRIDVHYKDLYIYTTSSFKLLYFKRIKKKKEEADLMKKKMEKTTMRLRINTTINNTQTKEQQKEI